MQIFLVIVLLFALEAIIEFLIEQPAMIAVLILLICIFVVLYNKSKRNKREKDLEENKVVINQAVKFIEEAYDMATNHPEIEPRFASLYITEGVADYAGFKVILFTGTEIISGVEEFMIEYIKNKLKDYSDFSCKADWQVVMQDDSVYLERLSLPIITCDSNVFMTEVWDTIKRKHPSWSITNRERGSYWIEFD